MILLQLALGVRATGQYERETVALVHELQVRAGLLPDEVVGELTWWVICRASRSDDTPL